MKPRTEAPDGILLRIPIALLELPAGTQGFLDRVGPKTRNMIAKATRRGYTYAEFSWNDWLDDIHAINTSQASRAGGLMSGWYVKPVERRFFTADQASKVRVIGGFRDGRLRAYAFLVACGDFIFVKHSIGHAEDLPSGVMNGLVFAMVEHSIGRVRYIEYGGMRLRNPAGLSQFKQHNGFSAHAVVLDCNDAARLR